MSFDPDTSLPPGAKIKVIGVGGGGGNAVNTMISSGLDGVDFVTTNTDVQALRNSLAVNKVQIGKELTRGLGAGADPDIGRDAALEDRHEIQNFLEGADMVFITAGMGGGTGTGGASVVAQIARELGALTVAVVTKPFQFEGKRRRKHAEIGVQRLRECVDTLITIPNQRLLQVAAPNVSMMDAFRMADEVLVNAVRGISDIINIPGTVNVDFADVKTVMSCMGQALMGIGVGEGEGRAATAAAGAISSPLLEDIDIEGATGILINITAGEDITLMEVNEACSVVQEAAHEEANIIFGAVIDPNLGDQIRVTVIATGFPVDQEQSDDSGIFIPKSHQSHQILHAPFPNRLTTPNLTGSPRQPASAPASRVGAQGEPRHEERRQPTESAPQTFTANEPASPVKQRENEFPKTEPVASTASHQPPSAPQSARITPERPVVAAESERSEGDMQPKKSSAVGDLNLAGPSNQALLTEPPREPEPAPIEEPAPLAADEKMDTPLPRDNDLEELANWTMSRLETPKFGGSYFEADDDPIDDMDVDPGLDESQEPSLAPRVYLSNPLIERDEPIVKEPAVEAEREEPRPARSESRTTIMPNETEVIVKSSPRNPSPSHIFASEQEDDDPMLVEEPESSSEPSSGPISRSGATANLDELLGEGESQDELDDGDMPLESYFGSDDSLAGDIDRKIDEALELAERMRNQDSSKKQDDDDLDVPAFLRNGMKDLPLD